MLDTTITADVKKANHPNPGELTLKLAKICGLFGSEHDGERASAAKQAHKLIQSVGLNWQDVFRQPPHWQQMLLKLNNPFYRLTRKEGQFVRNLLNSRHEPTKKQIEWLADIYDRVSHD